MNKYIVCGLCHGEGKVVNPNIDAHGISAEEFNDDPDFAESYINGDYDIPCTRCKGLRVILESEEAEILEREYQHAADRRLAALEDGDFEGYCSAGDARYG